MPYDPRPVSKGGNRGIKFDDLKLSLDDLGEHILLPNLIAIADCLGYATWD